MKKSSTHRASNSSLNHSKSFGGPVFTQASGEPTSNSRSTSVNKTHANQTSWTPDRSATVFSHTHGNLSTAAAMMGLISANQVKPDKSGSFAALTQQMQQQFQRSPLVRDTANTSFVNDISMDRSQQNLKQSVSPMRASNNQNVSRN